MSGKGILALGAVLAVLLLGFWLTQRSPEQARIEEDAAKRIFAFEGKDVAGLTVERAGAEPVAATRQNGGWAITAPHAVAADSARLDRVAEVLSQLVSDRSLDVPAEDLPQYGLDKPALRVEASAAGRDYRVEFGGVAPTQDHRYARVDDGPVLLLRSGVFPELDLALKDLRNRAMVDAGPAGIQRFQFVWMGKDESGKPIESVPVELEKRPDGRWYVVKPVEGAAHPEAAENLAAMLYRMPGRDFVDAPEKLADYGLEPPKARITAWTAPDAPAQTVYVGGIARTGDKDGVYVKRADAPAVFVVESGFAAHFPQTPDSLLARTLLTQPALTLKSLHYRRGDIDIVLENDVAKGWRMTQPAVAEMDQEATSSFINALTRASVKEMLGAQVDPKVVEPRTFMLEYSLKDGRTGVLAVGPRHESGDYYALQDTGMPVLVSEHDVEPLLVTPFVFETKEIFEFPRDKTTRLMLHLDGVQYVFERSGGDWLVTEPAGKRWETQGDASMFLNAVNPVLADSLEATSAPADPMKYGLDAPALVLEAVWSDPARGAEQQTARLTVGAPSEGDSQLRYATVSGRPEVFRIRQSIVDVVREALRGIRDTQ